MTADHGSRGDDPLPGRPAQPPAGHQPAERLPGPRRRHRDQHDAHRRVGGRRDRPARRGDADGRGVHGGRPRLAHGGAGQLRGDPVPAPAGRRLAIRVERRGARPPRWPRRSSRPRCWPARRSSDRSRAPSSPSRAPPAREPRAAAPRGAGLCATVEAAREAAGRALGRDSDHAAGAGPGRCGRRRRRGVRAPARRVPLGPRRPAAARAAAARRPCAAGAASPVPPRRAATWWSGASATRSCTSCTRRTRPSRDFKEVWAGIGDSIVVVGGDGTWNCHIHTDDIGAAIEAALDCGRPRSIRVTDLAEQVEEERWVARALGRGRPVDARRARSPTTDVVAVVTGDGIGRIFRSLGVHHLVPRRPVDEPLDRRDPGGRRRPRVRPGGRSCPTTRTSGRWPSRSTS